MQAIESTVSQSNRLAQVESYLLAPETQKKTTTWKTLKSLKFQGKF